MGNCCFKLPIIPSNTNGNALLFDSLLDDNNDNNNKDWLVLDHDTGDGLLTMILTLEESSDLEKTSDFIETHATLLKNVLFSKPRRSSSLQPTWTSPQMRLLFQAIGRLPHLEVLLLHEVGTSSNPIPVYALQHVMERVHPRLKQTYLVGHFVGDNKECSKFAVSLKQQPQLQSFALYGNGSREFTLDPILQAVSQLPTLKYLYFHGNMPNPLASKTVQQVGRMSQLETLTIHSCDTNGRNLSALAKCLENSQSLKELTVFEAFEMFQGSDTRTTATGATTTTGTDDDEDNDSNNTNENRSISKTENNNKRRQSCAAALTNLLRTSTSLQKVQIWFGFCTDSTVLQQFATALVGNSQITQFETALLWTEYDDDTAKVYLDMIQDNVHLIKLQLCGYKGCWRLPLWFYVRLNQTGRNHNLPDKMTACEWIDILTDIPPLTTESSSSSSNNTTGGGDNSSASTATAAAAAALEDAPADPDWFATSWRYYYLRMQPSLLPHSHPHPDDHQHH